MSDLVDKLRVLSQHLEEHDGGHARIHAEAADRITFLEAWVERLKEQERKLKADQLQSERDDLREALEETMMVMYRWVKRFPDPAHLRTVLALAEGHGVLGMPDTNEKKALDHLRATLKTEATP